MTTEIKQRILIDPNVHFGKPCVAGARIPVMEVLELVSQGLSFEQITSDYYPDLEVDDVRACIQYAMEVVASEDIHVTLV